MKFMELAKRAEKFTSDNSPLILTAVGTAGVITTGVLAAQAGFKAAMVLEEHQALQERMLTRQDKVQLTWMLYIPAAGTALLTCGAVIGANQIGTRRAAAIAAAYSVSEKAFSEYKEKVVEKLGEKKEQGLRDDLAQDRVNDNPVSDREVIIVGSGEQLCMDAISGQYFKSDMESIKHAVNRLNYQINNDVYASLTDFYNYVGIKRTVISDELGWTDKLLDVHFTTTLADDGRPAIVMNYSVSPVRNYFRVH